MVQPLRKLIPLKKYKGSAKLIWMPEAIAAFKFCQVAITNCQELYFLEDTATPILQTDASDYGIGGYVFMVTNGKVRVVHFYSKALTGAQLNWSVREKECYGIFYGVRLFEDLLDNRPFILKTDHKNLTYLNVTLTGKVLRWKLYSSSCIRTQVERTENLFQDFPRNFLPRKGLFSDWFLMGETPHISVQPTSCITLSTYFTHIYYSRV